MVRTFMPDAISAINELLFAVPIPSPNGGQPRITDLQALASILFVLKTGLPWEDLPAEMNCGTGMSCWRRVVEWQADGTSA